MKTLGKLSVLFIIGGFLYTDFELRYRGFTHWTMFILGGLCFVVVGGINRWLPWRMPIWGQAGIGAVIITAAELVAGIILNRLMGLGVWDYSSQPLNLFGQICLPFIGIWYLLAALAILLDDFLRWKLFGEEKPRYTLW